MCHSVITLNFIDDLFLVFLKHFIIACLISFTQKDYLEYDAMMLCTTYLPIKGLGSLSYGKNILPGSLEVIQITLKL